MRALVTGAAGFVGSHLCDRLLKDGWAVVGYDNMSTGRHENLPKHDNFHLYISDIGDYRMLEVAFREKIDAVFHVAAATMPACDNKARALMINSNSSMRVAMVSAEHHVPKFVYSSTCSVYGDCEKASETTAVNPRGIYASSKYSGELAIKCVRDCTILRYASLYGPRHWGGVIQKWQEQMRLGKPVTIYGDGDQTRTMTSVFDVVDANIRALNLNGIYNVCGPTAYTMNEIAHMMGAKNIEYIPDPTDAPRYSVISSKLGYGRPFCV